MRNLKKVLVICDNELLLPRFRALVQNGYEDCKFLYAHSALCDASELIENTQAINLDDLSTFKTDLNSFSLIISLHCRQIFRGDVLKQVRVVNIHPGYNPYNRGMYPEIFSIVNHLPTGATIHEVDEKIDHGVIICQKMVEILPEDTSKDVYEKIIDAEVALLRDNLRAIIDNRYSLIPVSNKGNYNSKKDFDTLCRINLDEVVTFREAIDRLRALTHGHYNNAYFFDENGDKYFVKIKINKDLVGENLIKSSPLSTQFLM